VIAGGHRQASTCSPQTEQYKVSPLARASILAKEKFTFNPLLNASFKFKAAKTNIAAIATKEFYFSYS